MKKIIWGIALLFSTSMVAGAIPAVIIQHRNAAAREVITHSITAISPNS